MKIKYLLLLGLIAAISSCSSAYRTGQTPDDVYYSPAPAQDTYVKTDNQQDRDSYYNRNEEQEIRRGIQDSRYRSNITLSLGYGYSPYAYDPFGYYYNPYAYNSYGTFGSPYSPYGYKGFYDPYGYNSYSYNPYGYNNFGYNYGYNYYNPYYGSYYPPVYVYPGIGNTTTNNGPRRVNLGAYNNTGTNANTGRIMNPANTRSNNGSAPVRTFNQSENRQTGVGNVIRRVFTPSNERTYTPPTTSNTRSTYNNDNNNTRNTNPTPARTFDNTPSTSTPSSSGSSSSGSAPVRTFRR